MKNILEILLNNTIRDDVSQAHIDTGLQPNGAIPAAFWGRRQEFPAVTAHGCKGYENIVILRWTRRWLL